MMLGLATATIVESSRIMKKPTIMAQTASQGLAALVRLAPAAPPARPGPAPVRPRPVAVVISLPRLGSAPRCQTPPAADPADRNAPSWQTHAAMRARPASLPASSPTPPDNHLA